MMTLKVQIVIGIVLILALAGIINMIRKRSIDLKYALLWVVLIIALIILDLFPVLMDKIAHVLGISSPVNMIFFAGFCLSLGIIFVLTVVVSRLSERLRELTQAVALSEKRQKELLKALEDKVNGETDEVQ